ncbi:MAG: SUMF1/EgtB/PvdO family nonheme iron enzyme [Planctomycetes bacterium]|nr:SUMF1/EgtB/PvdO family nonheme iron enzyme [Planctomycetota bacterium]MBL7044397.1 SUMF1/EgtB/PvdO family nonheme iron enzyme [Pirellulaceae bacterium]
MKRFCLATLIVALPWVWTLAGPAGEEPSSAKSRVCPVDGEEITAECRVEIVGLRLYACSEECLKKIADKGFITRQLSGKLRSEPEQIPVNRTRELRAEDVLADMVPIEDGEFVRRSRHYFQRGPEPVSGDSYKVQISAFHIDKHEVTNGDYCKFLNAGNAGYWTPWYPGIKRDEDGRFTPVQPDWAKLPVGCVNHYQARAYAQWAGKRLPTEAEWEFAAAGKEGRTYPWGDEEPGETRANYGPRFGGRKPVGSFPAGRTPEGVFDLAGNIGEWCADYYDEDYYRKGPKDTLVKDPQGPESGSLRVHRVGCQCKRSTPTDLRPNARCASSPLRSSACLGFRCARSQE